MRVTWQVVDGYECGGRPQETVIDDDDLDGLNEYDQQAYIEECVQHDFEANITWLIITTL